MIECLTAIGYRVEQQQVELYSSEREEPRFMLAYVIARSPYTNEAMQFDWSMQTRPNVLLKQVFDMELIARIKHVFKHATNVK